MKLIRNKTSHAGLYISQGWEQVFKCMGWEFKYWDGSNPEKTFEEYEPNIYIGDVRFCHLIPSKIKNGRTKVIATVDQWSSTWAFPEQVKFGYYTKWYDKIWIKMLRPQFLFTQVSPRGTEIGWNKWKSKVGLEVVSFMCAGDIFASKDVGYHPEFACDVGYVGGYWRYKAQGLREYLLNYSGEYNSMIFGSGWPEGISRGFINDEDVQKLYRSATLIPCIHEPHSRIHGYDILHRLFQVPLCGGFTVSDPVKTIYEEGIFREDEILVASSPEDMREKVRHFVNHPDKRFAFTEKAKTRIMVEHTYFHRVGKMLMLLGFDDEFNQLTAKMQQLGLGVERFI